MENEKEMNIKNSSVGRKHNIYGNPLTLFSSCRCKINNLSTLFDSAFRSCLAGHITISFIIQKPLLRPGSLSNRGLGTPVFVILRSAKTFVFRPYYTSWSFTKTGRASGVLSNFFF